MVEQVAQQVVQVVVQVGLVLLVEAISQLFLVV